jgi:glucosamine--fructose-6-phosphate aminotransferase (isomerizing)
MRGIVGYIGKQKAASLIIEGLKRLEYRGYDSAGIAVFQHGRFEVAKKAGRTIELEKEVGKHRFTGTYGIGHTRWATHGGVTDANAHHRLDPGAAAQLLHRRGAGLRCGQAAQSCKIRDRRVIPYC